MIVPLLVLPEASKLIGVPAGAVVRVSVKLAVIVAVLTLIVWEEVAVTLLASATVRVTFSLPAVE